MKLERSPKSPDVYQQLNELLQDKQLRAAISDLEMRAHTARRSVMDVPDPKYNEIRTYAGALYHLQGERMYLGGWDCPHDNIALGNGLPVQPKDAGSEQLYVSGLVLTFDRREEKVFFTDTSEGLNVLHISMIQHEGYLVMDPFGEWWTVDAQDPGQVKKVSSPLQRK